MKFLLWGRILNPGLITPFYHITVYNSSLAGAYSSFSTPKRARTLVWEQHVAACAFIWYMEVKPKEVSGIACGRNIHDYCTNVLQFRRAHPESSVIWSGCWPSPPQWKYGRAKVQRLEKPKVEQDRPVYEWTFCLSQRSPCCCYCESGSNLSHMITTALILPTHEAQPIGLDYSAIFREKITGSGIHMDVLWPWKVIYGDR